MRKIWGIFLAAAVLLSGCKRYDPVETAETPLPVVVQEENTGSGTLETEQETEGAAAPEPVEVTTAGRTRAARETACESKRNLFICPCGGK